jgi:hypothetical protein
VGIIVKAAAVSGLSAPAGHDRPLAVVTLIVWLCTASIGAYMLRRWVLRGGLRRPPAAAAGPAQRLPPGVIIGHFSLALTGLLLWALFVVSGWDTLAWSAAGVLMPAIGLGVCTVTLWTPYPTYPDPFAPAAAARRAGGAGPPEGASPAEGARRGVGAGPAGGAGPAEGSGPPGGAGPGGAGTVTGPAGGMLAGPGQHVLAARLTDETLARALTDETLAARLTDDVLARSRADVRGQDRSRPKGHLAPLIPVAHGMGALATFLLVVLTAIGAR